MTTRFLTLTAALMLVAACGTSSTGTPKPSPSASLEAGWSIITDKTERFAIQLPAGWVAELRDSPKLNDDLTAIATDKAALAAYIRDQLTGTAHPHVKLVAADPSSLSGLFITNYNVVRDSLGDAGSAPNLAEVGRGELAQIKGAAEPAPAAAARTVHLPAGDSYSIAYTLKLNNGQVAAVTTYIILADQGGKRYKYEITFGTLTPDLHTPGFNKALNSFTLLH